MHTVQCCAAPLTPCHVRQPLRSQLLSTGSAPASCALRLLVCEYLNGLSRCVILLVDLQHARHHVVERIRFRPQTSSCLLKYLCTVPPKQLLMRLTLTSSDHWNPHAAYA